MIGHYFTSAIRKFSRAPLTAGLNILGLALGLACFILAIGVSRYWDMSDAHFANADRTYILMKRIVAGDLKSSFIPDTSPAAGYFLREDFPGLEAVARIGSRRETTAVAGDRKASLWGAAAERELLDIFDFTFIEGAPATALDTPDKIVLTEDAAHKLFGDKPALGETVRLSDNYSLTVSGVIRNLESPTHFTANYQGQKSFDFLHGWNSGADQNPNWFASEVTTYLLFPKDALQLSPASFQAQLDAFIERRIPEQQRAFMQVWYKLLPLSGFQSRAANLMLFKGRPEAISIMTMLALLGALVLVVSCINYTNLASVQAASRGKEVGMRKVLGADRRQIFVQYWTEALLFTMLAAVLALLVFWAAGPLISNLTGIDLRLGLFTSAGPLLVVGALIFVVSLAASLYPVAILARVQPIEALRAGTVRAGPKIVMQGLVAIQFAITGGLIIILLVVNHQNGFIKRTSLSQSNPVVMLEDEGSKKVGYEALSADLAGNPNIEVVTQMNAAAFSGAINLSQLAVNPDGEGATVNTFQWNVGYEFFSTFDAKLVAGRLYERERREGATQNASGARPQAANAIPIIVDTIFLDQIGQPNANSAIGQRLYMPANARNGGFNPVFEIIGVIEPVPLVLSGFGVSSTMYSLTPRARPEMVPAIKISGSNIPVALKSIREAVEARDPNALVKIVFLDDAFEQGFKTYNAINTTFITLSVIAFVISIMGLFAMAAYVAGRRRHEIGVRKTLGASTGSIVALLLRDFSRPVVIGNLIAWPAAYFGARIYLDNFLQKIELTPWPWVAGFVLTLAIAWLAVGGQAWRAARVKPADVLRYE